MPIYNLTNISNVNTTIEFVQNVNTELMSGFLGLLILIGITTVVFISFHQATNDTKTSIAASAFIAFTLSIFLAALQLLNPVAMVITLIIAAAAIGFTWKSY